MKKIHFIIISGLILFSSTITFSAESGAIFTANEGSKSISMVKLDTKEKVSVKTSIMPHNVQATPDGKYILATGMPGGDHEHMEGMKGKLVIINTADFEAGVVGEVEIGEHPAHVVTDSYSNIAYVTDSGADNIAVVDLKTLEVTNHISTGKFPHGLRMTADGKKIYVANLKGGSVSAIDVLNEKAVAEVVVGKTPIQVAISVDGKYVYVSLAGENAVAVVDTETMSLLEKIPVGHFPAQVFTDPKGRYIYVANQGTEEKPDQTISVIDVATNKVVKTIETGLMAHGIVTSNDGDYVYVTNMLEGNVSVIDVNKLEKVSKIQVESKPNGITYISFQTN